MTNAKSIEYDWTNSRLTEREMKCYLKFILTLKKKGVAIIISLTEWKKFLK